MAKSTKSRVKAKGGAKLSSEKGTMNPPSAPTKNKRGQTNEPYEQDPDRDIGQHTSAGKPALTKK